MNAWWPCEILPDFGSVKIYHSTKREHDHFTKLKMLTADMIFFRIQATQRATFTVGRSDVSKRVNRKADILQYDGGKDDLDWRIDFRDLNLIFSIKK